MAQIVDINPEMGDLSAAFGMAMDQRKLDESARQFDEGLGVRKEDLASLIEQRKIQGQSTIDAGKRADASLAINQDIHDHNKSRWDGTDEHQDRLRALELSREEMAQDQMSRSFEQDWRHTEQKFGWEGVQQRNQEQDRDYNLEQRNKNDLGTQAVNEAYRNSDVTRIGNILSGSEDLGEDSEGRQIQGPMLDHLSPEKRSAYEGWMEAANNPNLSVQDRAAVNSYHGRVIAEVQNWEDAQELTGSINQAFRTDRLAMTNRKGQSFPVSEGTQARIDEMLSNLSQRDEANPNEFKEEFNQMLKEADEFNRNEMDISFALASLDESSRALSLMTGAKVAAAITSAQRMYLNGTSKLPPDYNQGEAMMDAATKGKALEAKTDKLKQDRADASVENFHWAFETVSQTMPNVLDENGRLTQEGRLATTQMMEELNGVLEENYLSRYDQLDENMVASLAPGLAAQAMEQTDQLGTDVAREMGLPPSSYEAVSADGFAPGGSPAYRKSGGAPSGITPGGAMPAPQSAPGPMGAPQEDPSIEANISHLRSRGALEPVPEGHTKTGAFSRKTKPTALLKEMAVVFSEEGMIGVRRELASSGYDPDDMPKKWTQQLSSEVQKTDAWKASHAFHSTGVSEGRPLIQDWTEMDEPDSAYGTKISEHYAIRRKNFGALAKHIFEDPKVGNAMKSDVGTGDFTADDFGRWLAENGYGGKKNVPITRSGITKLFIKYGSDLGYSVSKGKDGKLTVTSPSASDPSPIPVEEQS